MARLREIEALRGAPRSLVDRRIAVGERGGLDGLSHAVHRALSDAGAVVAVLHHPDESEQATVANRFEADVYLCLDLDPGPHCTAAFFQVPGFESVGGRRLAELLADTLPAALDQTEGTAHGMRRPVLRETRMPAVACRLGPPAQVVERTAAIATAVRDALARWAAQPLPG